MVNKLRLSLDFIEEKQRESMQKGLEDLNWEDSSRKRIYKVFFSNSAEI